MSNKIRRFGLIGFPLGHSFSPSYFAAKFEREGILDCRYDAFPLASLELLPQLLAEIPELEGLNITIPYKSSVMQYLDHLSEEAAAIGAVNVIKIKADKLLGYNSDVHGFEISLRNFLPQPFPQGLRALVLGTGGSASAVRFALEKMGVAYRLVSRRPSTESIAYEGITAEIMEAHQLIINTTPLGMSPHINICPSIPYDWLTPDHYCYDLVYNPEKTRFLALAETKGCPIQNGLPMLYLQAERAWEIWQE